MPYWHMGYYGIVWDIFFWVLLIWLFAWVLTRNKMTKKSPMDVLKMRYAQGEVTKKEYEQIKKEIK